jgi:hypothetical protein
MKLIVDQAPSLIVPTKQFNSLMKTSQVVQLLTPLASWVMCHADAAEKRFWH